MARLRWEPLLTLAAGGGGASAFLLEQAPLQVSAPRLRAPQPAEAADTAVSGWPGAGERQCPAPLAAGLAAAGAVAAAAARRGRRRSVGRRAARGGEVAASTEAPPVSALEAAVQQENPIVLCKTTAGNFRVEVLLKEMPITASNFIDLVARGFYDGLHIHRVVPGFVIQFGCRHTKEPFSPVAGMGGPRKRSLFTLLDGTGRRMIRHGGKIPDEFDQKISNLAGTLSMCNMGMPDTGGSQFFVNVNDNSYLDWFDDEHPAKHPVFAKVVEGYHVVVAISQRERDRREAPKTPVQMISMELENVEFEITAPEVIEP